MYSSRFFYVLFAIWHSIRSNCNTNFIYTINKIVCVHILRKWLHLLHILQFPECTCLYNFSVATASPLSSVVFCFRLRRVNS